MPEVLERIAALCAAVPSDLELGFHLCYGDFGAKHFIEPQDTAKLVEMANALTKRIGHPVSYIHMPVPAARSDHAYFRPLGDLQLGSATKLYLGLVHASDGADGTRKRIAAAQRYVRRFGIASECGMARARTPEVVRSLSQGTRRSVERAEMALMTDADGRKGMRMKIITGCIAAVFAAAPALAQEAIPFAPSISWCRLRREVPRMFWPACWSPRSLASLASRSLS